MPAIVLIIAALAAAAFIAKGRLRDFMLARVRPSEGDHRAEISECASGEDPWCAYGWAYQDGKWVAEEFLLGSGTKPEAQAIAQAWRALAETDGRIRHWKVDQNPADMKWRVYGDGELKGGPFDSYFEANDFMTKLIGEGA